MCQGEGDLQGLETPHPLMTAGRGLTVAHGVGPMRRAGPRHRHGAHGVSELVFARGISGRCGRKGAISWYTTLLEFQLMGTLLSAKFLDSIMVSSGPRADAAPGLSASPSQQ